MNKTKNSKKKKLTIKEVINSTKFLTIVFILLLILVIVLSVMCYKKNEESKKNGFANISIPITELDSSYEFSISAPTLASTDEYIFKVTNTKDDKINSEEIPYKVTIENETDCVITIQVNDNNKDLMQSQKSTILTDKLAKDSEDVVYYHVKVKSYGDLGNKDLINIRINS